MQSNNVRRAAKAGSWYTANAQGLEQELQGYMNKAQQTLKKPLLKAIIGPHAGFAYSGPTAAWAYKNIDASLYSRVVLLGPSHSLPFQQIGLTTCNQWATPFGNLSVDTESTNKLLQDQKLFISLKRSAEEDEHSLEMHLPFIKKVFSDAGKEIKLLPMMVGQVRPKDLPKYATALTDFFMDPETLFIISSDFCHWGDNFDYKPIMNEFKGQGDKVIHKSIEALDKLGMDFIEKHDLEGFQQYLSQTQNTICGERPIQVLLALINAVAEQKTCETKFVNYNQSNAVQSQDDMSVSYASSYTVMNQ